MHWYTPDLAVESETRLPPVVGGNIEFASGLVALEDGHAMVAYGIEDMDVVVAVTKAEDAQEPALDIRRRYSYLDAHIPVAPTRTSGDSPTLCLNMIVKNESKIITRLLATVHPIIDCFCICDTGSTDNTVELIETYAAEHGCAARGARPSSTLGTTAPLRSTPRVIWPTTPAPRCRHAWRSCLVR